MSTRHFISFICGVLTTMLMAAGVCAQDTSAQKARREKLEKEIAIIDRQLADNASKSSALLSDLSLLRKKISNRKALVTESDKEIRRYSDEMYLTQRKINRLQERVDTLTEHYSRLVMSAYKNRDSKVWYMYMLASDNLGQAFRRFGYFKNLSSQMKTEAVKIRELQKELEQEKEKIAQMKKEAQAVKKQRVADLESLKKEEAQATEMSRKLKKNKKTYEKQLKQKRQEVAALNREIERIIQEAKKAKSGKSSGGSSKKANEAAVKLSAEFSQNKGKLPWPAEGPVVGGYGRIYDSDYNTLDIPENRGIDIAVMKGADVKAVFDGVVHDVATMLGHNQCVLVVHGDYFTLYCNLKDVKVKAGQKVRTGDILGSVATISGMNQVHFELWHGDKPENPIKWLYR